MYCSLAGWLENKLLFLGRTRNKETTQKLVEPYMSIFLKKCNICPLTTKLFQNIGLLSVNVSIHLSTGSLIFWKEGNVSTMEVAFQSSGTKNKYFDLR